MNDLVIDAKNATLGRLASYCAKQALLGKKVAIVNCNEAVIVGNPRSIIKDYSARRKLGGTSLSGPFHPKHPSRIVKRTIRGMLSHRQMRGNDALKRVMCYDEVPEEYKDAKKIIAGKEKKAKTITLQDLGREM